MRKLILFAIAFILVSCSDHAVGPGFHNEVGAAVAAVSIPGNDSSKAGPTSAVSGGTNTLGVSGPTAESAAFRIANGLEGNASVTNGNLRQVLSNVKTNLPKVTNVNNAAGYDQVQLLAYAACADVVQNGQASSVYNIQMSDTVANNQAALVAAGVRILDAHTGGLASQSSASTQVNTVLTTLVQTESTASGVTTKMAFMAVCIAANSAGSTLLGM